jgi:hypothetical protein
MSKTVFFFLAPLLLALSTGFAVPPFHAHPSGSPQAASPTSPAGSVLAADKGKFRILVNGQEAGTEEFEIAPSHDAWVAHGVTELRSAQGPAIRVTGTLRLAADGTPLSYEWSTEGPKKAAATIQFQGSSANIELRLPGSHPFNQQFTFSSPRVVVLDNNLYHQYAVLARLYDWEKKGSQTISVLVPQSMTPGTVNVESVGLQAAEDGKKFQELRVRTEDLEVNLFLDGDKLMRIVVPASNAEIIRE